MPKKSSKDSPGRWKTWQESPLKKPLVLPKRRPHTWKCREWRWSACRRSRLNKPELSRRGSIGSSRRCRGLPRKRQPESSMKGGKLSSKLPKKPLVLQLNRPHTWKCREWRWNACRRFRLKKPELSRRGSIGSSRRCRELPPKRQLESSMRESNLRGKSLREWPGSKRSSVLRLRLKRGKDKRLSNSRTNL